MDAKELLKLYLATVDDRKCAEFRGPFRQGCDECERYSNKGAVKAKHDLDNQGFSRGGSDDPFGRARQYVALLEALEMVQEYKKIAAESDTELSILLIKLVFPAVDAVLATGVKP